MNLILMYRMPQAWQGYSGLKVILYFFSFIFIKKNLVIAVNVVLNRAVSSTPLCLYSAVLSKRVNSALPHHHTLSSTRLSHPTTPPLVSPTHIMHIHGTPKIPTAILIFLWYDYSSHFISSSSSRGHTLSIIYL